MPTTTTTTTTVSETNRYIPTNTLTTRSSTSYVAVTEYSSRAKQVDSKTSLAYSGMVAMTRSETGLTTSSNLTAITTSSHSGTVTTASVTLTRMNPWSRGLDTPGTSVTTVASSSHHSQLDSPEHEEVSLGPSSLLMSAGSGDWDSEEEKEKMKGMGVGDQREPSSSLTTNETHAPNTVLLRGGGGGGGIVGISVTPEPSSMDLNEEFPPLSKHGRSQSDPQVSSAECQQQAQQDSKSGQASLSLNLSRLTQSLTSQIQGGSSSNYLKKPPLPPSSLSPGFTPSVPPIEGPSISSENGEKVPKSHRSASGPEKLPFASPSKMNQLDPAVLQGIKGADDLEKTPGSRVGRSGSEDGLVTSKVPSSLAVGGDVEGKVNFAQMFHIVIAIGTGTICWHCFGHNGWFCYAGIVLA